MCALRERERESKGRSLEAECSGGERRIQAAGRQDIYLLGFQATLVGLGSLAKVRTGPNPYGVSGTGQ